ncbi:MAG TPA: ATP-dependent Clp protease proteolytic subunit [Roseimicrobium sp.]|nr:ATP-dependent Clp protease proteolytic subunit [Roseimicrobium sp.]
MNLFRRTPKDVRTFRLEGPITDETANQCIAMLLFWRMENPREPGRIEIDSPGGSVTATLAILDTMAFVGYPIHTHCPNYAYASAALILARGTKGFRSAGKTATIAQSPVTGGIENSTADPEKVVEFMIKLRNRVIDEFRNATDQTREEITEAQEHERVFSAGEALACGYIDHIT